MSLYFGETEMQGLHFGDTEITGLYFGDTEIWAAWSEYDGTLPATYTANGSALADYRIYGASGGVGDMTEQLFDAETAVYKDGLYKNDSGNEATYPGAGYYDTYIPITPNETIYVIGVHGSLALTIRLYFYDAQKQWIRRTNGYTEDFSVVTPSNAAYAQLQISPQFIPSPNTIMITQGSTASYVPYGYVVPMAVQGDVYINKNDGLYGYTIRPQESTITPNNDWWVSGYIPVVEGATYTGVDTGTDLLLYSEIGGTATGTSGLRNGYTIPQGTHYMKMNVNITLMNSFTLSVEYLSTQIYIGSEPLGEDEYVDYGKQKIYRMSGGVLTPTDPPVPLPALPTVDGTTITDYAGQSAAVPSRFYAKYRKG